MFWGFEFPWADPHQLNLDWILQKMKETQDGVSDFSSRLEETNAKVSDLENLINAIPGQAVKPSFLTVGPSGCRFTSVIAAVEFAKTYATSANRVCIVITPGQYVGSINLIANPGIDLWGNGDVTIVGDKGYPEAALFTTGRGCFAGIRFQSQVQGTYALHIEALTDQTGGGQNFYNCDFAGMLSGVGIGDGAGMYQTFRGCKFYSYAGGNAVYIHNIPFNDMSDTGASFENCSSDYPFYVRKYTDFNSQLHLYVFNSSFSDLKVDEGPNNGDVTTYKYVANTASFGLLGKNNNLIYLNNDEIMQYSILQTIALLNNGTGAFEYKHASLYDWTATAGYYADGSQVVLSEITLVPREDYVEINAPQNKQTILLSVNASLKRQ